ncbi:MAG: ribosome-associated translation inhibitor RaiA [Candidatus Binatia bacterium]|nr:ribosome-associated translation inhibitor RaiA [Candidatus Binatia bacterium]
MNITVTFRHVNVSDGLRNYATQKVERLKKFARHLLDAHVILAVEKQRHRAEIVVTGRHLQVTAVEETTDLYSALDLALDKIERQLKKWDEKRKDHKVSRLPEVASVRKGESTQPAGVRVTTRRIPLKPMSLEEALLQLEQSNEDFFLFHDEATDSVSILHRKKDGELALIQPELA